LLPWHGQHLEPEEPAGPDVPVQPGAAMGETLFAHPKEHLGLGHLVGLWQSHVHLGAEQVGLQAGVAGVQTVWQRAGKHTFSQTGHPPDWQLVREQRTSHFGFSQRISQDVSGNLAHLNSHCGFSH